MTKKMVLREQDVSFQYSTLSELKSYIEELIEEYGPDATYGNREGYDGCIDEYIAYYRLENDEEYNRRITRERRQEENERQQYERLRKKFEGD
jgi:hypothetical protein